LYSGFVFPIVHDKANELPTTNINPQTLANALDIGFIFLVINTPTGILTIADKSKPRLNHNK
jgi:hypothetical protein